MQATQVPAKATKAIFFTTKIKGRTKNTRIQVPQPSGNPKMCLPGALARQVYARQVMAASGYE